MDNIVTLSFLSVFIRCGYSSQPFYTVIAPKSYRPNFPYHVLMTIHYALEPVDVVVSLINTTADNIAEELTTEETFQRGETKLLELEIGNWDYRRLDLQIHGSGGLTFEKTVEVFLNSKTFTTFIQTDKGIYQPEQTVHFRVIITKPVFLPHNPPGINIYINDPYGNRIKQWSNVTFTHGVFSNSFQLSDEVNLGEWVIYVKSEEKNEQLGYVTITVAEYVLPKFEVSVRVPPFIIRDEPEIVAVVQARYTYGKTVKGHLTLNITEDDPWSSNPESKRIVNYSSPIDGNAEIHLNPIKDLQLDTEEGWFEYGQKIRVSATVVESLTEMQMSGESDLRIYNSKYKLTFDDMPPFKPGIRYTTYLTVSLQDDTPIIDSVNEVAVYYTFSWTGRSHELKLPISSNGKVKIEVLPPATASTINFKARYLDRETQSTTDKVYSLSERYIHISTSAIKPQVGDEIEIVVNSTKKLENPLIVLVIGRGKFLHTENVPGSQSTMQSLPLKLTKEMAPEIRILVYYMTCCGEIIADALVAGVEGAFKTPVELSVNPNSTKPGSSIEISVKTNPSAYVAFSAVDQSVLLLTQGNDLTARKLLASLRDFEIGIGFPPYDNPSITSSYSIRPYNSKGTSSMEIFENAGLHLFTNGLVIPARSSIYNRNFELEEGGDSPLLLQPSAALEAYPPYLYAGYSRDGSPPIRKHFPESFLWMETLATKDGTVSIKTEAPDTITSYIISAFAVDDENGIGLNDYPSKLQVFRPFFVTLNTPYSVIRGETLALQVLVFNYLEEDTEATVTLENKDNEFSFINLENEVNASEDQENPSAPRTLNVKAGNGASTYFHIIPGKVGYIDLKVIATSSSAGDAVLKKLLVKAEGVPVYVNKAIVVDLREEPTFKETVSISFPDGYVPESERIVISAISDILGTTVNNLHDLLKMPYGCGEQNLLNFVPNIVVVDYLQQIGKLTPEIKAKALHYMESGYQRQLTYKREDGSFSTFGNYDPSGSTWLTAFVVKSFVQASKYITIDVDAVQASMSWLLELYSPGSFPEGGKVFYKAMQGGSSLGLGLTAYVLSALLEAKNRGFELNNTSLDDVVSGGLEIVESKLQNSTALFTNYDLVFITYVLHLANRPSKDYAFTKMNERSKITGDMKFWTMASPEANTSDPYSDYNRARSVDVEMTSYALLTYSLRGMIAEGVPIMRWLLSKRNENGGFESTQDTVVGIHALAQFAKRLSSDGRPEIDVKFSYEEGENNLRLEESSSLVLNKIEIPKNSRTVDISAAGKGLCILQVSWSYNVLFIGHRRAFQVSTNISTNKNILTVTVCTKYIYETGMESNMAIMEVGLPSGYVVDKEHLPPIDASVSFSRVDTKQGDTIAIFYFDKISDEVSVHVIAYRKTEVYDLRPSLVEVYDYYEPGKRGEMFYSLPPSEV